VGEHYLSHGFSERWIISMHTHHVSPEIRFQYSGCWVLCAVALSGNIHGDINNCALSAFALSCMENGGRYGETSYQRC